MAAFVLLLISFNCFADEESEQIEKLDRVLKKARKLKMTKGLMYNNLKTKKGSIYKSLKVKSIDSDTIKIKIPKIDMPADSKESSQN
jgi:hypothetical protein